VNFVSVTGGEPEVMRGIGCPVVAVGQARGGVAGDVRTEVISVCLRILVFHAVTDPLIRSPILSGIDHSPAAAGD
jgi:hypothetical protein